MGRRGQSTSYQACFQNLFQRLQQPVETLVAEAGAPRLSAEET
jgi:hypothetical protein